MTLRHSKKSLYFFEVYRLERNYLHPFFLWGGMCKKIRQKKLNEGRYLAMKDLFLHDSLDTSPVVFSDRILYTPTSFAKTVLLYLQEIGSLQAKKPHTSSRTRLSSYLFFCVDSGFGELEYQGSGISWARGTACSLIVSCRTRTVRIQTYGLCRGSIFPV